MAISPSFKVAQVSLKTSDPPEAPGLSNLPVEILLYILQAVDSLSDLKSLILTASRFNDVWKCHTASISSIILRKNIECFTEVSKLEEAIHSTLPVGFQKAVARHKRIISAARLISAIYELFSTDYNVLWGRRAGCSIFEDRGSFKRSFYWIWMMVVTSKYKPYEAQRPLNPFPLHIDDLLSLCELIVWVRATAYTTILGKTYAIYHRKDRIRCARTYIWKPLPPPMHGCSTHNSCVSSKDIS